MHAGAEQFTRKQYEAARESFAQAYALDPAAVALLDLAMAELETNRPVEAAAHFRAYLARPDAEEDKRGAVQAKCLPRAEAQLGRVLRVFRMLFLRLDGVRWRPRAVGPPRRALAQAGTVSNPRSSPGNAANRWQALCITGMTSRKRLERDPPLSAPRGPGPPRDRRKRAASQPCGARHTQGSRMHLHSFHFQLTGLAPTAVVAALAFSATLGAADSAEARSCASDASCPLGFQCSGGDGGPSGLCVSGSCESNSDCASGFDCATDVRCVPGPDAALVGGSACVPQWQAPCVADSDCGQGFQCVIGSQACDCSGSDAGIPADAEVVSEPCSEAQPPAPPCANDAGCPSLAALCDAATSCLCWGITRVCQQNSTSACSTSIDCPSGWSCACGSSGGAASSLDASSEPPCDGGQCQPPNVDLALNAGLVSGGTLVCGGLVPGAGGANGPGGSVSSASGAAGATATAPTTTAAASTPSSGSAAQGCSLAAGPPRNGSFFALTGFAAASLTLCQRRRAANASARALGDARGRHRSA